MLYEYKKKKSLEDRKLESNRVCSKYLDRVPIIVEKCEISSESLEKNKYLVPCDFTIGQFLYVLRKQLKLSPEKAMFCYINNILPNTSSQISSLYKDYKDEDGFLYIHYSTNESVFG
jgi:GABA(A) receptor-associated protein